MLTNITSQIQSDAKIRRRQDNLIFARIKEDRDFDFNKNRENRFTVSGFRVTSVPPSDPKARKEFFRAIIEKLVLEATPELDPPAKVTDVYVNMRYGRGPPFIEGKMDTVANSNAFRIAAHNLIKEENPNFVGLFIANSVTLATRVRIEILRAVADTLQSDVIKAYVQPFTSRPILHVQMRDPLARAVEGSNRSYNFVEAVSRWGDQLSQASLIPAYRKARPAFIGALEQYFVVLTESGPDLPIDPINNFLDGLSGLSGSNRTPLRGRGGFRGTDPRVPGQARSSSRGFGHSFRGRGARSSRALSQAAGGRGSGPSSKRRHSEDHDAGTATPTKRLTPSTEATPEIFSDAMEW
jgi:hypothetical protein